MEPLAVALESMVVTESQQRVPTRWFLWDIEKRPPLIKDAEVPFDRALAFPPGRTSAIDRAQGMLDQRFPGWKALPDGLVSNEIGG